MVSVALLTDEGTMIQNLSAEAGGQAGGRVLTWLREWGVAPGDVRCWVADVGPGGFTGARVGVMLAKTLAWSSGASVAGVTSFDLIAKDAIALVPGRKGQWVRRVPGQELEVVDAFDGVGYWSDHPVFPDAARAAGWAHELPRISPHELLPLYALAPSISVPKSPYKPEAIQ